MLDSKVKPTEQKGLWQLVGTSVTGVSHEKSDLPCQDAHAWRHIGDDWAVIAVADGAGSVPLSDVGARRAVDRAVEQLGERLRHHVQGNDLLADDEAWQGALHAVLIGCRDAIEEEAAARGRAPRDFACTLLLAVLGPQETIAIQVGDGAMVLEDEDGQVELLTAPDSGEYINETTFLVSAGALESARFAYRQRPARSAAVFTDGIQMLVLKFPTWEPSPPFFQPVFGFFHHQTDAETAAVELERMLRSTNVRSRTDDDVTLVVASRRQTVAA